MHTRNSKELSTQQPSLSTIKLRTSARGFEVFSVKNSLHFWTSCGRVLWELTPQMVGQSCIQFRFSKRFSFGADSLYLKFKRVVVNRVLAVGLIILCLILNYLIWSFSYSAFTAIIFILTFDSSVALVYRILGPLWVYWFFWKVVGYVWYTVSYMWTYPYISAGVICGLFLFSTLYSVYQWRRRVERREWNEDMIRSIALRLQRMEEQQNKILKQNEDLKHQIETLLRRSSSHNSR